MNNQLTKVYEHRRGIHCITTTMMNVLNYHGISLSEELCFGIGSGLGFTYTRGRKLEQFLVFGRNDDLELNLCEMLGVHVFLRQHADSEVALDNIIEKTAQRKSIVLDLDISKLPYIAERLKWPETSSHGGHKVLFGGYNADQDEVLLYEYLWMEPQRLKRLDFFDAWGSFHGLAPACNMWHEFEFPVKTVPLVQAIKNGIEMNVFRMLSPWNRFHGLEGLRYFLRESPDWKYLLGKEDRMKLAYASFISLERAGTGKGAFRTMFSRFLRAAANKLGNDDLEVLAKDYLQLSRLWSEYAYLLYEGSKNEAKGIFSGNPLNERLAKDMYQREKTAILTLQSISSRLKKGDTKL